MWEMHYKMKISFFLQFAAELFFSFFALFFPDKVQKYNSIHRVKTFDSSFSLNSITSSLK